MLIIFGSNEKRTPRGKVIRYCPVCRRETQHTREERKTRITLYFIPVIPLGSRQIEQCNTCGHENKSTG